MNVGAKSDAGPSAWDQLTATPNHDHPIRQPQPPPPMPMSPVVKQPPAAAPDVKPPEYGEELHPELVSLLPFRVVILGADLIVIAQCR